MDFNRIGKDASQRPFFFTRFTGGKCIANVVRSLFRRVVSRVVASTEFDLPSNSLDRGTPPLTPGTILIKGELPTDA